METMYDRIKKLRNSLQYSQEQLAKKVGYADKTSIAKIEAGKVDIPQSKILMFANALNTTTSYLMDGSETIADNHHINKNATKDHYETTLLEDYRILNETGKEKARDYVRDLSENTRYTEKGDEEKNARKMA